MGGWYAPHIFKVNDLELINYWLTCDEETDNINALINYSDEFKGYIGYKNFAIDIRMGDGDYFYTFAGGIADFKYKGITYAAQHMEVQADHILYVPDDTQNTPEALLAAAKQRVDGYVGAGKVALEYVDTVFGMYDAEHFAAMGGHLDPDEDLYIGVDEISKDDHCYKATVNGVTYMLVIKKGADKMVTPRYESVDVDLAVSVALDNASIPLDTQIAVEQLVDGEKYDALMDVLKAEKENTFDIQLYSASLGEKITRLEDGAFKVRVPVYDGWNGEQLKVYYVADDNQIEEYAVEIANDGDGAFATFETTHFSIYTLAATKTSDTPSGEGVSPSEPQPQPEAQPEQLPDVQTGYANVLWLWVAFAVISGGTAVGLQLRKKHN